MKATTPELERVVLTGAMATISAATIREHHGNPWPGDHAVYDTIAHAQHHAAGNRHACAIIAAAKVQVVAEAWGAKFPFDQAWSQSELQRLLDIEA